MSDFEVHPVGTNKRIQDLVAELERINAKIEAYLENEQKEMNDEAE